jgi:PAS domain S-box-containing protein
VPGDRFIELATHEGKRVLDALFKHANEAVTLQEHSGRLLYANDRAASLVGFDTAEEMLAASQADLVGRFELVDASGTELAPDALPGRRVLAGEPFVEEVVGYRLKGSLRPRWSRVHASPVKNDAGEVVMAINFFLDITDQIRREEIERLTSTAHEVLGSSLDRTENLEALLGLVVPGIGSLCSVHVLEGEDLLFAAGAVGDGCGVSMIEPGAGAEAATSAFHRRVVASRKTELLTRPDPELTHLTGMIEEPFQIPPIGTAVGIPLIAPGGPLGVLTVGRADKDGPFDEADVDLLQAIGERAVIGLENARLYQEQHHIAQTLQRGLMPRTLPQIPGLELAARYRPLTELSTIGGDFFDVVALPGGGCAVLVGDIAGKGIEAAAAVGMARHTLRSVVALDPRPLTVFERFNAALRDEHPDRLCTLAYLRFTREGAGFLVQVALAGHPPPLLLDGEGVTASLGHPAPPVGAVTLLEPFECERLVVPGDLVVVYTDGYTLPDKTPVDSARSAIEGRSFRSAESALSNMMAILQEHPSQIRDDVALVAVRVGV